MDGEIDLFGPLGKIPDEVVYGPSGSGRRWIELNERALACLKMRNVEAKGLEADRITKAYHDLISECKDYERRRNGSK